MAKTAQSAAKITGQRAHIGTFPAFGLEHRVVRIGGVDQLETADLHRTCSQFHRFAVAGEVVSALALDLDCGITRRHLLDATGERRQERTYGAGRRSVFAARDHPALGIVGVALFTPAHREAIELATVHDEGNSLGRLTERDRQDTGRERIKRAGMARALGLEQAFYDAHGVGRRHADRLVENDPAVHVVLLALFQFRSFPAIVAIDRRRCFRPRRTNQIFQSFFVHSLSSLLLRSRFTSGERSSLSMRSASANRSSTRNRISGANFRLMRCAISERRYFLWRSKAATTSSASRPPIGIT